MTTTIHGDQLALFDTAQRPLEPSHTSIGTDGTLTTIYRGRTVGQMHASEPLLEALEAAELKRQRQRERARAVAKGAETSRAAFLSLELTPLEEAVVAELEARGPGTAEELGERLSGSRPDLSAWGPQTMSGTCNRLLHKRRIQRTDKRPGRSGRLAWIWALRPASTRDSVG